ncbi:MAG: hypothetical protein RLZ98_988 [Pseudomonadota bacterium]|jgi:L-alanine-DL-glutamate epimerase-like enolase superfamily enzyme
MRITGFEQFHADGGWDEYAFLKVTTDEGLVGWSEFNESRRRRGLGSLIMGLGGALIGEDPRAINHLDAVLQSMSRSGAGGLQAHANAAILNACVDIKAKSLGVPVYELYGGKVRDRIPLYWSRCGVTRAKAPQYFDGKVIDRPAVRSLADLEGAGREAREAGFKALKTNLLLFEESGVFAWTPGSARGRGFPELDAGPALVAALRNQLAALRRGAGDEVELIVDLNFNYRIDGYRRLARAVEDFDLMWLEMDILDAEALASVRQGTRTPIGSLEAVLGRRALKPYLQAHAVDVAIIDVQYNGFPEAVRMAQMCDAWELNVASHGFTGPLSTVMTAHFCAGVPNLKIMEIDVDEVPWRTHLLTCPYRIEDGAFVLPDGAGWGTDIDESAVASHPQTGS